MALVYNPRTGQLEENGVPSTAARLLQPANDLGTIIRGGLQGIGNTVGGAVVAPLDAARSGLTSLVGGDPNSLGTPLADTAFGLADQGFADAGAAASRFGRGLQGTALNLLGAQPAPATPAQQLVNPTAPPVPAAAAVAAPVDPQVAAAPPTPPLTADALAGVNAGIAQTLAASQAPVAAPAATNSFSAQNTTAGTGAPATAGLNFGFGVNGAPTARQVLDQYAQQDRQARLDQQVQADRLNQASLVSHLNDPFASTQDKKIILAQLGMGAQGLAQTQGLATQNAGATVAANAQAATAAAQLATQREIAAERNQTALESAKLTGTYGLQAALAKADATKATAAAGQGKNRLANAQADLAETQLNAALVAQQSGLLNPVGLISAVKTGQTPVQPQDKDPLTGLTYTPEALLLEQQRQLLQSQAGLLRQQQR